ncbi:MAG: hypothetical protein R3C03_06155 [Pirellulaceae bacterium]
MSIQNPVFKSLGLAFAILVFMGSVPLRAQSTVGNGIPSNSSYSSSANTIDWNKTGNPYPQVELPKVPDSKPTQPDPNAKSASTPAKTDAKPADPAPEKKYPDFKVTGFFQLDSVRFGQSGRALQLWAIFRTAWGFAAHDWPQPEMLLKTFRT